MALIRTPPKRRLVKPAPWPVNPREVAPEWRWAWDGLLYAIPFWAGAGDGYDVVNGLRPIEATHDGWIVREPGAALLSDDDGNLVVFPRTSHLVGVTDQISGFIYTRPFSGHSNTGRLVNFGAESDQEAFTIGWREDEHGRRLRTRVTAFNREDVRLVGNDAPAAGELFKWGATYDGSIIRGYLNGVEVDTQSQTGNVNQPNDDLQIFNRSATDRPVQGEIYVFYLWRRALLAREMEQLARDPFGPFRREERVLVTVADEPPEEGATVSVPIADTEAEALTPSVQTGVQLSAPVADTEADALLPAVRTGTSVSAPVADTEAAAFAPSVETGVRVTVPPADTDVEALAPSVETGASATVPVADTTAEALTPTVDTTEGATVAVPVAETTADAPLPTVHTGARVSVPVADTETDALTPSVSIGTVVAVPVADTEADALAPEVRTGTTLQVPLADTVSDAMAPEVRTGVMVSVGVAETEVGALVPGLTVGIEPVLLRLPYTAHWIDPAREAQWKTPGGGVVATDQELALSDGSTLILSDGSVLVLGQTERVSPAREATWKDPARTAEWSTT